MLIFESNMHMLNEHQVPNYMQQETFKMFNSSNGAGLATGTTSTINGH
jgi:hypothetical protein